jgi:hypothetical protein
VKDERIPAENLAKALTCGLCPAKTDPAFVKALVAVAYLSSFDVNLLAGWKSRKNEFNDYGDLVKYVNCRLEESSGSVPTSAGSSRLCIPRA